MLVLTKDNSRVITLDKARDALRRVVKRYGADMTYRDRLQAFGLNPGHAPTCVFSIEVRNGPHGKNARVAACLIGVIMVEEFGYDVEQFITCNQNGSSAHSLLQTLPENHLVSAVDSHALEYFGYAQGEQDRNKTWGEALEYAEKGARDNGWVPLTEEEQAVKDADAIENKVQELVYYAEYVNGNVLSKIEKDTKVQAVKFLRDEYAAYYGVEFPSLAAVVRAYKVLKERVDSKQAAGTDNTPPF